MTTRSPDAAGAGFVASTRRHVARLARNAISCDNGAPYNHCTVEMPEAKARKTPIYVVRNSPIHGRGVFAGRTIRKGTCIVEYRGERISMREAERRPDSDPDNPFHTFLFELNDGQVDRRVRTRQRGALDQPFLRSELRALRGRRWPRVHRGAAHDPQRRGARVRLQVEPRRTHLREDQARLRMPLRRIGMPRHDAGWPQPKTRAR